MPMIGSEIKPFNVQAFQIDKFLEVSDNDLRGKWSVLFFYPADFTFVCPTELEDLADHYKDFQKLGVQLFSVSTDKKFSHKAWHDTSEAIKKIQFVMIADPSGTLCRDFGVLIENEDWMAERATFVIDPEGRIQYIETTSGGVGRSATQLLSKIEAAQYVASHPGQVCPAAWKEGEKTLTPSLDLVGKI
ncbi:alkyl hydroperoxide reductase subunit C [Oecophyllibacter saccharovorans]|uniref:Alkyl hydroperoxide reductase C n=1 Tax=Oecophyllibacter saccharovorans TaxID=2558360 RepID=A0A506UL87_9PROT|nr:alkyl hydroperoxide reductase subunit C [Oecophyllibacter saccharovorans]QDH15249.1 peroxiredoxin [Oecophyllibacter saccharovorans]TPW34085.1 peroxiredoxin [Oecophyllibacter saccharovorans]TPW36265.1 peroxiredoxin [Oecophyllibacter saccharovorans]